MTPQLEKAYRCGFERLAVWADLLDDINVYPVADGDTGKNLVVSLAPLKQIDSKIERTLFKLHHNACGNSGNIAVRFFAEFLLAGSPKALAVAAEKGRESAWAALVDPLPGTLLTVLDALADYLCTMSDFSLQESAVPLLDHLALAVQSTPRLLPELQSAGVVDAGALGIYIFFEGFFHSLRPLNHPLQAVSERFTHGLEISPLYIPAAPGGYCVEALIQKRRTGDAPAALRGLTAKSVVVHETKEHIKLHLHAKDKRAVRKTLGTMGEIVNWHDEPLAIASPPPVMHSHKEACHLTTDAAGSLTRQYCRQHNISLFDSYILLDGELLPETRVPEAKLYQAMRQGLKVSTAQASLSERRQHLERALAEHEHVLYLCVGSAYTGNFGFADTWQRENDTAGRLTVIDTGAASGRLAILVMAVAEHLVLENDAAAVIRFAKAHLAHCREFIFPERMEYLARSGRMAPSGARIADLLRLKPVISPTPQGAKPVGIARGKKQQLNFAIKRLMAFENHDQATHILLEYTDNRDWVADEVLALFQKQFPGAFIAVSPFSLTSAAHMGPGTWGVAFFDVPLSATNASLACKKTVV